MRLLVSALLDCSAFGREPGAWPRIFSFVGFAGQDSDLAKVFVLRAAAPSSKEWAGRFESQFFWSNSPGARFRWPSMPECLVFSLTGLRGLNTVHFRGPDFSNFRARF